MTKKVSQSATEHYILPERRLSGTRDEVLAQIDELILGLRGLRQIVSLHGPTPAEAPRRSLRLVKGFLAVLLLIIVVLWALPAAAQTAAEGSSESSRTESSQASAAEDSWRALVIS
jgi:hypothetical protein